MPSVAYSRVQTRPHSWTVRQAGIIQRPVLGKIGAGELQWKFRVRHRRRRGSVVVSSRLVLAAGGINGIWFATLAAAVGDAPSRIRFAEGASGGLE